MGTITASLSGARPGLSPGPCPLPLSVQISASSPPGCKAEGMQGGWVILWDNMNHSKIISRGIGHCHEHLPACVRLSPDTSLLLEVGAPQKWGHDSACVTHPLVPTATWEA